jgi:peptidoglycan/LPS O-acetylase OafA/YrhL
MVYIVLMSNLSIQNIFTRFLGYYGSISYSTYLYHNLFVGVATLFTIHLGIHDGLKRLLFTFYISGISYRFIEKPFVKIGKKIVNSTFNK